MKKGFTLIELLVVIAIIGTLSTLAMVNFNQARIKARDGQRKTDIGILQSALEQYRADHGSYPVSQDQSTQLNSTPCGQPFQIDNLLYQKKVPCDPLGAKSDYNNGDYYYFSDGLSYTIGACLENKNDPDGQATAP